MVLTIHINISLNTDKGLNKYKYFLNLVKKITIHIEMLLNTLYNNN